jgi:hypothetical protein
MASKTIEERKMINHNILDHFSDVDTTFLCLQTLVNFTPEGEFCSTEDFFITRDVDEGRKRNLVLARRKQTVMRKMQKFEGRKTEE